MQKLWDKILYFYQDIFEFDASEKIIRYAIT